MLGRFGKDASSLLGVEITPPFIRLVRLRQHRGRYSLQAWALEPLPLSAMHNGWIAEPEQVGAALLRAVQRSAGRAGRVMVALPGGLLIEKLVSMPSELNDEAIAEHLPCEVAQFIPFALEDAALDFQVIDLDPDDSHRQRVAVAACHLALLETLDASLEFAGMQASVVEPDNHALHRALQVDDALGGLLLQVEGEALIFHERGAGPVPLRREVVLNRQGGFVQSLVAAVDNYLLTRRQRALPDHLLLLGAGVADHDLPGQLQLRLGMDVRHANPFKDLALAPGVEARALMAQAPYLAVACGLAMWEGERCLA